MNKSFSKQVVMVAMLSLSGFAQTMAQEKARELVFSCRDMVGYSKATKALAAVDVVCIWRGSNAPIIITRGNRGKREIAPHNGLSISFDVMPADVAKARRLLIRAHLKDPKKNWIVY